MLIVHSEGKKIYEFYDIGIFKNRNVALKFLVQFNLIAIQNGIECYDISKNEIPMIQKYTINELSLHQARIKFFGKLFYDHEAIVIANEQDIEKYLGKSNEMINFLGYSDSGLEIDFQDYDAFLRMMNIINTNIIDNIVKQFDIKNRENFSNRLFRAIKEQI